jgi:hypothetical protein
MELLFILFMILGDYEPGDYIEPPEIECMELLPGETLEPGETLCEET